jgi:hypothetical protein
MYVVSPVAERIKRLMNECAAVWRKAWCRRWMLAMVLIALGMLNTAVLL